MQSTSMKKKKKKKKKRRQRKPLFVCQKHGPTNGSTLCCHHIKHHLENKVPVPVMYIQHWRRQGWVSGPIAWCHLCDIAREQNGGLFVDGKNPDLHEEIFVLTCPHCRNEYVALAESVELFKPKDGAS